MSTESKSLLFLQSEPYPLAAGERETRENERPVASDSDSEGSLARGYRCQLCGYETRELSSFSEHLRETHPISNLKRPSAGDPETAPRNGETLPPGPGRKTEGGGKDVAAPGKRKRKLLTTPKEDSRGKMKTPKLSQRNSAANFSTNHNSVVCLPLVSEGLKLVWTQSDQTSALDSDDGLVEAFNRFPYPSAVEIRQLCQASGLPLDKVKVWFMVQRIKYGISWSSEEIEETRLKLGQGRVKREEGEEEREIDLGEVNDLERNRVVKTEENGNAHLSLTNGLKPKLQGRNAFPVAVTTGASHTNGTATGSVKKSGRDASSSSSSSSSPLSVSSVPLAPVSSPSPASGRYKKSKAQLAALRFSFGGQHFPSEAELRRLQDETGLTRNEIRKWFSDSRYQLKNNRASGGNPSPSSVPVPSPSSIPNPSSFFESFLNRSLEAVRGLGNADEEGPAEAGEGGGGGGGEEERLPVEEKSGPGSTLQTPLHGNSRSRTYARKGKSAPVSLPGPSPSEPPGPSPSEPPGPSPSGPSPLTPSGRRRKTKEQLAILKAFFLRCQWPQSSDYSQLVLESGLPRPDVIQWFGDTRYAVKNGQLRWVRGAGGASDIASDILHQQQQQQQSHCAPHITAAPSNSRAKRRREAGSSAGVRHGARAEASAPGSNPSVDMRPLERYLGSTGFLQERDLDLLCKKSRMTYQQVRDWFLCQQLGMAEVEVDISDGEE
ncbi:homeobox and leucine zipper protein Homez [Huso huso]|uniref:Homeobox and leucine zipper protein Homez n=1 Tax=Huso huso TaxID=61971 RepID=A0ABR0Y5A6_HUSHU